VTVLGVDVGGTKIAAGRVTRRVEMDDAMDDAMVEGVIIVESRAADGFDRSIASLWSAIEQTLDSSVEAIGIAAPGPLDPVNGIILNPPNLPGWRDVPLARMARERFGLPVRIENDCNAAALGEARYGAGRGHANVFYAAIGTGIGAGIVFDGKIYRGAHGLAGEAGHMTVDYRSRKVCGCGSPGCIEALASGAALARRDSGAEEFIERIGAWLGGIVSLLDPGVIVLGGGVMLDSRGEDLFAKLREMVPTRSVNPCAALIPIVPAYFGVQSGIVGAAVIFE